MAAFVVGVADVVALILSPALSLPRFSLNISLNFCSALIWCHGLTSSSGVSFLIASANSIAHRFILSHVFSIGLMQCCG